MADIDATRFGISNGAVTVASMILAMYVTGAPKRHILTALLALVITDPIGDAHSMYVADKGKGRKKTFMLSFGSQFAVQLFFFCTEIAT